MTAERCGLEQDACRCDLDAGHEGFHECQSDSCGGRWTFDADGNFVVDRFPGTGTSDLFAALAQYGLLR